MRIAVALILFACFGPQGVRASEPPVPGGLTVHRSVRGIPRRFTVRPNGATVAANQTQRFEVTDAQGRPVAVHWSVSGLGCSGLDCGTIDAQGVYRTPSSLPKPRIVVLEGVLVSDPNYSVLKEIELVPAIALNVPASAPVASEAQQIPMPAVGKRHVAERAILPLSGVIAPPPAIGWQHTAATNAFPPLLAAVSAAPAIGGQTALRTPFALPLPNAIAASPVIETQADVRVSMAAPLPKVTAPPPMIDAALRTPSALPLSQAIPPSPVLGKQIVARNSLLTTSPKIIEPPPLIGLQKIAPKGSFLPLPLAVAASPVLGRKAASRIPSELPLPKAIGAPPAIEAQIVARGTLPPPQVAAPPPAAERQVLASRGSFPPLPLAVAASPVLGRQAASRISWVIPLPRAIGAPPAIEGMIVPRGTLRLPLAVPPVPVLEEQKAVRTVWVLPQPTAIAAPPVIERQVARHSTSPLLLSLTALPPENVRQNAAPRVNLPLPVVGTSEPASDQVFTTEETPRPMAAVVAQTRGSKAALLLPMPDEVDTAMSGSAVTNRIAPTVTYRDGQLTIDARNSTLAEVLKLVAEKTGATIDVPPGTGLEPIAEHDGPGPAQDVLARLLNGAPYDFIIVSSPQRPHGPAQVLLSLRRPNTAAGVQSEAPKTATASPLWAPPEEAVGPAVLSLSVDPSSVPPKEALTPETLSKMMRERAQQIRDLAQPQQQ
jgi:hypothetical protein